MKVPGQHVPFLILIPLLILLASFSLPASADSFYPNSGVDTTDDPATVPAGRSQFILNYEWDENSTGPSAGIPNGACKYGISRCLDFGIAFPYTFTMDGEQSYGGFNDCGLGFKYCWTPGKEKGFQAATVVSMKPAMADTDNGMGNGVCDYAAHMVFSHGAGKWNYTLNYGYNFWGPIPDVPRMNTPYYKFKVDYEAGEKWALSAEAYGQDSPNRDVYGSPMQTTIKTTWQCTEHMSFDFGMAFGLNSDAPVRRYLLGITMDL